MQMQRGFVGLPVLIWIVLGIIVVGGGAYYVVQQQAPTQTASENFDDLQQLPTTNNQAEVSTQNPAAQDDIVKKPSATIDSLVLTPTNRTITGTASGVSRLNVGLYYQNSAGFTGWKMVNAANVVENIPVVNGRWSFTVNGSDELVNGTTLRVIYDGPNVGTDDAVVLASGKITSASTKSANIVTTTCVNGPVQTTEGLREGIPVITSISPVSGPKGTKVTLTGCNLSGFEGDHNVDLESESGSKVRIVGAGTYQLGRGERGTFIELMIKEPCQKGETVYGAYSGLPSTCNFVELMPGKYKVSTTPWGEKSNDVYFTLTK